MSHHTDVVPTESGVMRLDSFPQIFYIVTVLSKESYSA